MEEGVEEVVLNAVNEVVPDLDPVPVFVAKAVQELVLEGVCIGVCVPVLVELLVPDLEEVCVTERVAFALEVAVGMAVGDEVAAALIDWVPLPVPDPVRVSEPVLAAEELGDKVSEGVPRVVAAAVFVVLVVTVFEEVAVRLVVFVIVAV